MKPEALVFTMDEKKASRDDGISFLKTAQSE